MENNKYQWFETLGIHDALEWVMVAGEVADVAQPY